MQSQLFLRIMCYKMYIKTCDPQLLDILLGNGNASFPFYVDFSFFLYH